MLTSTRTRRGFRAPSRRRPGAAPSLPLLSGSGAAWAFVDDRAVVPAAAVAPVRIAPAAPVAPVLTLVPALVEAPAPEPVVVDEPVVAPAPVRVPAGAASVRVASAAHDFRVVVVDLDDDSESSVLVSAASPLAARRECADEFAAPVAVFAVLPGGVEELVWGEAA